MIKKIYNKYHEIIQYAIFGIITVIINLLLYKVLLILKCPYIASNVISYVIASILSYFFNLKYVFHAEILPFRNESIRVLKYFSVRIFSIILDNGLLIVAVEVFKFDKFYSKFPISVLVILITYIFNKTILKKKEGAV